MAQPGRDGIQVLANLVLKHIDKLVLFLLIFPSLFHYLSNFIFTQNSLDSSQRHTLQNELHFAFLQN